jgi:HSP20 family protein
MTYLQVHKMNPVPASSEQLSVPENSLRPRVDVYHSPEEFIFLVDLPGVKQGDAQIEINERNTLILKAKSSLELPEHGAALAQIQVGDFYRAFELGDHIDRDKVQAKLEQGVLEIRVSKKEQAKPRKIEIQV